MSILDGKKLSEKISFQLSEIIKKNSITPKLAIIQVGNLKESDKYVSKKIKFAETIGANCYLIKKSENTNESELISEIKELNTDKSVHGIIVQLPLPNNLNREKILSEIKPEKDIDGLNDKNLEKLKKIKNDISIAQLFSYRNILIPATTRGILELLNEYNIEVFEKKITMVGYSRLIGIPTAIVLEKLGANLTICDLNTKNISDKVSGSDIVISAVGKPGIINSKMLSPRQVIVDIGISLDESGKIKGDVDLENTQVAHYTPVPGGVGPMTVAALFENLLQVYT